MIAETKNPGLTAILALIVGIGLFGIGHIYVGRLRRGILLLLVSIVLHAGLALLFPFMMLSYIFGSGAPQTTAFVLLSLVNLVLWIWQSYDAYNLAKQFNEHVEQYGKAPW
jgi:TM2 domain-containing membrane protein YozV